MKFEELDLVELFLSNPVLIHGDEQAGVFMYSVEDKKNVSLVFLFDVYEGYCEFSLSLDNGTHTLCEYRINNVEEIRKEKNTLIIIKNKLEVLEISFRPFITIGTLVV